MKRFNVSGHFQDIGEITSIYSEIDEDGPNIRDGVEHGKSTRVATYETLAESPEEAVAIRQRMEFEQFNRIFFARRMEEVK